MFEGVLEQYLADVKNIRTVDKLWSIFIDRIYEEVYIEILKKVLTITGLSVRMCKAIKCMKYFKNTQRI